MIERLTACGRIKEKGENKVLFTLEQEKPCPGCNGRCGLLTWKKLEKLRQPIWIKTDKVFKEGEQVEIHYPAHLFVKNTIEMYLLPLFTFIAGIFLGDWLLSNELFAFILGIVGLMAGILYSMRSNKDSLNEENILISYRK